MAEAKLEELTEGRFRTVGSSPARPDGFHAAASAAFEELRTWVEEEGLDPLCL